METLNNLAFGLGVALSWQNLLYCFIGCFLGTLVGVLPGIGPVATMSLLVPVTLSGTPAAGIIMMAGIYYGAKYGGSTTSVIVSTEARVSTGDFSSSFLSCACAPVKTAQTASAMTLRLNAWTCSCLMASLPAQRNRFDGAGARAAGLFEPCTCV